MASEQRLIGAVGIKVRPVTKGFREEIQQQLRNLPEGKVNVEVDADTRKAEKKIKDVSEDQKLNLRVGVTYDDLEKAKRQLQAELKRLGDVVIPVKLDKQGIQEALGKLDELGKKSSVVMKISADKEGYEAVLAKIRAVQREKIVTNAVFEIDDASLAKARSKYERLIEEVTEPREITITYGNDRKSLQRALDTVNAELEKLSQVDLNITADPAMLANTRDAIQDMLDSAPVVMKYGQDKAGYQAVLKKIQELRAEKLVKEIEFHTDDESLALAEMEMNEKLLELNEKAKIKLEVTSDYNKMLNSLGEVDKALKQLAKVEIEVELDKESLEAKRREIEEGLPDSTFDINVNTKDVAQLKKELDKIRGMLVEEASEGVTLTVAPNEESLRQTKEKIEELIRDAERDPVKLKTEPVGLALAATQIGWASRSRVVPFYIRIDNKSRDIAEGVLKSLSGYNTLSNLGTTIENLATNFDTAALKGAQVAGVLGNVVNVLGYGVTNLLSIGDGVGKVIGLTAMAPAALSALAAMVLINVGAFSGFKDAIQGSDEAMSRLPPNAQAAAQALKGTWESIQKPIQNAYWEEMGTSLQDMVSTLLPKVRDGLAQSSTAVGRFAKNTADTFRELGTTDMFDKMFTNLSDMFTNASGAAEPLTRALNTIGLRGSEYLPQFGTWLTEITTRFNDWIQTADANRDINRWIEDGVDALKDMWSAGDGVVDVIRAITKASMAAGGTTLHELADEMQRWGQIASGEPFQSRLTAIFRGAREGASNLNKGFLDLARSIGESAGWVSNILSLLGELGGVTLSNLSLLFQNGTFKGGLYEAVSGVTDMMKDLAPTFDSLGTVIGTLGTTAGAAFRGLAPLINTVSGALEDVAEVLGDELPGMATALTGYMSNTFGTIASVIGLAARAVEPLLKAFLAMPDAIQSVLLAAGGFMIMRGQISKMMTALHEKGHFNAFKGSWTEARQTVGTEANRMVVATQMVSTGASNMKTSVAGSLTASGTSFRNYVNNVKSQTGAMATVGTAISQPIVKGAGLIKAGLGGVVGFLGGPLGAALTVGAAGLSLYAQAQADAKAKVDSLAQSLDQQTGAATDATKKLVATDWMQVSTSKWDDFWRGVVKGSQAAHETVKLMGDDTAEITDLITQGGPAYDAYISKLDYLRQHLGNAKISEGTLFKGAGVSLKELSDATGYTVDQLREMDVASLDNLRGQVQGARDDVIKAEQVVHETANALRVGDAEAAAMGAAIEVLGDKSATASERVEAMRTALDRLSGGTLPLEQAGRNFAKSWESAMETLTSASTNAETGAKESWGHLIDDVDGHILDLKGKGGVLYDATKSFSDALIDRSAAAAQHVLDNKGTMEEAQAAGVQALQLSKEEIAEFASAIGVSTGEAEMLLSHFTGQDWEAKAILSADNALFFQKKAEAEAAGKDFTQADWEAALKAKNLTDLGLSEAQAAGENWESADYTAVLGAMPESAVQTLAETLGVMDDGWRRGDFSAILTALDGTGPGVAAALLAITEVRDGDYTAEVKALLDALSLEETNAGLDGAADADRSADIRANPTGTFEASLAFETVASERDAPITAVPWWEAANSALNTTALPRNSDITGVPWVESAANALNTTALPRNSNITGVPWVDNAAGALNRTALPRNANITGIPWIDNALNSLNRTALPRDSWFNGRDDIEWTRARLDHMAQTRQAWFVAVADVGGAAAVLNSLSAPRTVYYRAIVEKVEAANGAILDGSGVQTFANGGITQPLKKYANGGIENHTAKIYKPTFPFRVFAEPETGGEAYIPMSAAKRVRSTQILEEVAQQFGYQLTKGNTATFASGGVTGVSDRTGGGVAVNIGSYVTNQSDTPDDVARAIMRRVKTHGGYQPLEAF